MKAGSTSTKVTKSGSPKFGSPGGHHYDAGTLAVCDGVASNSVNLSRIWLRLEPASHVPFANLLSRPDRSRHFEAVDLCCLCQRPNHELHLGVYHCAHSLLDTGNSPKTLW